MNTIIICEKLILERTIILISTLKTDKLLPNSKATPKIQSSTLKEKELKKFKNGMQKWKGFIRIVDSLQRTQN